MIYNRIRHMGGLGQADDLNAQINSLLLQPDSVGTYVLLVLAGMGKLRDALEAAKSGDLTSANIIMRGPGPRSAAPSRDSVTGIKGAADTMLERMLHSGAVSGSKWDELQRDFGMPFLKAIGEVNNAEGRGSSFLLRTYDNLKAFFAGYESTVDAFFRRQSDKIVRLYRGVNARIAADSKLLASIQNAPGFPEKGSLVPAIAASIKSGMAAKSGLDKIFSELEITPSSVEAGTLGQGWGGVAVNVAKPLVTAVAKKLGWRAASAALIRLAFASLFSLKTLAWLWHKLVGVAGIVVVAWIFDETTQQKHAYEESKRLAKSKTQPENKPGWDVIYANAEEAERQTREATESAKNDFPTEAALYASGGSQNWILYALGLGAAGLGLYLYFQNKKKE